MTVAATEELVSGPYNGNGVTTQFDYGFRVYADTEVKVVRENADGTFTTLTLTTDYTVAGVNAVTGRQITLVSGDRLPTGAKLTIEPDITLSQERPFGSQSSTDLSQMERSYDKLTSMVRQVFGLIQRVPVAAAGSVIGTIKVGTDGQTLAWMRTGMWFPALQQRLSTKPQWTHRQPPQKLQRQLPAPAMRTTRLTTLRLRRQQQNSRAIKRRALSTLCLQAQSW